ncbi:helix-turn-helix transcriptional regulator [Streptomyces acidiscabies]|uniref:helix-turn-helix transcriptional regulator n=1 Tax=Streptomyces acidiscabies TaxID=42234 RepID=UPI0038F6C10A
MTVPHPPHGVEELCEAGAELYERALQKGHIPVSDVQQATCLVDFGLLHPAVGDLTRLEPVSPTLALHRMLRHSAHRIADERKREERLAEKFERLVKYDRNPAMTDTPALRILSGNHRINQAITEAMASITGELLTIQPSFAGSVPATVKAALERDQALLDRGGRIRALYQHTQQHRLTTIARYEQLRGDAEARTLDQVTDRLIIIDRAVAFIPANEDRTLALEVRQPALINFFTTTFDRLWNLATPMYPQAVRPPSPDGITPRQRTIAALLVEGHTDAVIADRLGMNVRTAREHIAKLATTLGSDSRAQLGYLIGQSGILDQEE